MRYKKLLLFVFFLFIGIKAFAAVFTVTSNAHSGAGTLRDALTQAALADSAQTNYINFNIADISQGGRTIQLLSQLPDVCSNLIIDGTTQPGAKFGVSDASIALLYKTRIAQTLSGLSIVNKHDVAIYGLYIYTRTNVSGSPLLYFWKGIELRNDINVTVGAAGKGNVISGFYYPLVVNFPVNELEYFENLTLKDNLFGVEADGETLSVNQTSAIFLHYIVGQVNIGGTVSEGNFFSQGLEIDQDNVYDDPADHYGSAPANINIQNNNIGVDHLIKNAIVTSSGLYLLTTDPGGKNTYYIEDNVIVAPNNYALYEGNNGNPIYMLRNYIGTDKTLTQSFKTGGIFIYGASSFAIGSTNPADANYITNCNPITIWPYSNVTVNKNSIYCTIGAQPMHLQAWNEFPFPVCTITTILSNSISGTATPNSSVELFYSDKCGTCSPQTYFASTTTDANGNWQYNGSVTGSVIASATLGLNTSDFTQTSINVDKVNVIDACGSGLGSIKGAIPQSAQNVKWVNSAGVTVGTKPDLINVLPGKYKLVASNGSCADSTSYYQIQNKFNIDTTSIKRIEPSCGNPTGSISGISIINNDPGAPYLIWQNVNGKPLAYSQALLNVPAGSYYLQVKSADSTCAQIYGPFTLKNTTGPNIDQSKAAIQSTNCGQSAGSITGITATGTGTLKYIWWNSQQQTVSTGPDLVNQPAGIYKLEVTDDSQCGPVYTTDLTIPQTNGITMDETAAQTTPAGCGAPGGSVTGIAVTGATQYQWLDADNKVVGTSVNLPNVGAGVYTLTASNAFGCTKTSKAYTVAQLPPTVYPQYQVTLYQACTGKANGGINVPVDGLVSKERWVNNLGETVNYGIGIANVPAGVYELYLTDQNGCETLYGTYEVPNIPQLVISGLGEVTNDACSTKSGSVTNIQVSGGRPPYTYAWLDANGTKISSSTDISGLSAGIYTFTVNDQTTCGIVLSVYTIQDQDVPVPAPVVNNVLLCNPGGAILSVVNPVNGDGYRLYASETSTTPIDQQSSGVFTINVKTNTVFYISQFSGECESQRTAVKVTVGLSSLTIENTFTPNGDGINDYWKIASIENYPAAVVQVFTRYGQLVFESKGYASPFDGTFDGKKLPAGVYYYIINLNSNCSLLSGSLTIIR